MEWQLVIRRNSAAVMRLLVLLVAMSEMSAVRRSVRSRMLRLLHPAESVVRRLIVIVAQGLSLRLRSSGPCPKDIPSGAGSERVPLFSLLDALRYPQAGRGRAWARSGAAMLTVIGEAREGARSAEQDPIVSAQAILRRITALRAALDDLPGQARRLVRWRLRRAARGGPGRVSPLRSGRPPGHRAVVAHPVDIVLRDCHELALMRLAEGARS